MPGKYLWKIVPLLVSVYIAIGDLFLPRPLGDYSRYSRETINNTLMGLFPDRELKRPYGKFDEAVETFEQEGNGGGGK